MSEPVPETESSGRQESSSRSVAAATPARLLSTENLAKEYNERKVGVFSNREIEVPGVRFDDTTEIGMHGKAKVTLAPHPIRTSLSMTSRTAGEMCIRDRFERFARVVIGYQDAQPALPEQTNDLLHFVNSNRIDAAERLVEQQQFRAGDQGAGRCV